jgi:hypothetical protein
MQADNVRVPEKLVRGDVLAYFVALVTLSTVTSTISEILKH